ncbi:MAG: hypothetical protein A3F18_04135 [Legionellales bacterium RIFCSPHIGHO2_12_FULL_37_14]|nr:MAG: hypothetical protein A3F18_04135 [Legionellales bacterium RIFCSPHIGHO2_12_FULL_37_14]
MHRTKRELRFKTMKELINERSSPVTLEGVTYFLENVCYRIIPTTIAEPNTSSLHSIIYLYNLQYTNIEPSPIEAVKARKITNDELLRKLVFHKELYEEIYSKIFINLELDGLGEVKKLLELLSTPDSQEDTSSLNDKFKLLAFPNKTMAEKIAARQNHPNQGRIIHIGPDQKTFIISLEHILTKIYIELSKLPSKAEKDEFLRKCAILVLPFIQANNKDNRATIEQLYAEELQKHNVEAKQSIETIKSACATLFKGFLTTVFGAATLWLTIRTAVSIHTANSQPGPSM